MAEHDYVIANQNGANTRSDLNNALAAIVSNNSKASAPTTTYAYMWWADTANDILKQRNGADSAWINILTLSTGAPLADYADNALSGNAIDGGTISNFTSTGIDDNATSTAITIDASEMVQIRRSDSDHTQAFTSPHLRLAQSDSSTDTTGFVGVTYAASNVDGYGWSAGAVRSTGGNSDFVYKRHIADQVGTEIARFTGTGLCFNGDTAAANALDDYEEGTWTPVIVGRTTAGAATYTIQTGRYTKIGNVVHIECRLGWSAHTGTGTTQINGLPFTNNDHYANLSIVHRDTLVVSSSHYVNLSVVPNQSYMYVLETSTGSDYAAVLALDANVADMAFSGTYIV